MREEKEAFKRCLKHTEALMLFDKNAVFWMIFWSKAGEKQTE